MPRGISNEQREEIFAGFDFGTTNKQIAVEVGVSEATVRNLRSAHGSSAAATTTIYDRLEKEVIAVCAMTWDFQEVLKNFEDDLSRPLIVKAAKIGGSIRTDDEISAQERKEIYRMIKDRRPLDEISLRYNNLSISVIADIGEDRARHRADIQRRWDARKLKRRDARIVEAIQSGKDLQQIVEEFNSAHAGRLGAISESIAWKVAKDNGFTKPNSPTRILSAEEIRSAEVSRTVIQHLQDVRHEILTQKRTGSVRPQGTISATYQAIAHAAHTSIYTTRNIAIENNLLIAFPPTPREAEQIEKEKHIGSALRDLAGEFKISVAELAQTARWGRRLENRSSDGSGLPREGYLSEYIKDPEQLERMRRQEDKERSVIIALRALADKFGITTATQARIAGKEAQQERAMQIAAKLTSVVDTARPSAKASISEAFDSSLG